MELSKAYDSFSHDPLIAKLATNGFGNTALALITDYLTNRLHGVKIGSAYIIIYYAHFVTNLSKKPPNGILPRKTCAT